MRCHRRARLGFGLLLGFAVWCSCTTPPDDGENTQSDGSADVPDSQPHSDAEGDTAREDAADAADAADTSADADSDGGDDGPADAADDGPADAADDSPADAAADAGVVWVVTSCMFAEGGGFSVSSWIDSNGGYWVISGGSVGNPVPPAGGTTWPPGTAGSRLVSTLSSADLAALIAAAQALDISTAGYTTVTGPRQHNITQHGLFYSAGSYPHAQTLVEEWKDGASYGVRTLTTSADPAAATLQRWMCFSP